MIADKPEEKDAGPAGMPPVGGMGGMGGMGMFPINLKQKFKRSFYCPFLFVTFR